MAYSYQAKNSLQLAAQLKVQEFSIPFTITQNATPSAVVFNSDEPAILSFTSQGFDSITPILVENGDTAPTTFGGTEQSDGTYTGGTALPGTSDATGVFYIMVAVLENVDRVVKATITSRTSDSSTTPVSYEVACTITDPVPTFLVQSTTELGQYIYLLVDNAAFNYAGGVGSNDVDACLTVQYVTAE